MVIAKNEQWILEYLRENPGFQSPTTIGRAHAALVNGGPTHHSSWASPVLKRMVKKGLVQRNSKGQYQIKQML